MGRFGAVSRTGAWLVVGLATGLAASSPASAYTSKVESACRSDYSRFCSAYGVGTSALRNCMESNGRNLSQRCVDALVKEGIIDRRRLRR